MSDLQREETERPSIHRFTPQEALLGAATADTVLAGGATCSQTEKFGQESLGSGMLSSRLTVSQHPEHGRTQRPRDRDRWPLIHNLGPRKNEGEGPAGTEWAR